MTYFMRDPIYDDIREQNHYIYKTIKLKKDIDIIQKTNNQKQKIDRIIQRIEYMNQNPEYFKKYDYKYTNTNGFHQLNIKTTFLPTMEMYISQFGFTKKLLDTFVYKICEILDSIDYHGHLTLYNIYTDCYSFYVSDLQFYDIYFNKDIGSKNKDLYDLVRIVYHLVPENMKDLDIFKKGLSKEGFQSTSELLDCYKKDIKIDFRINKKDNKII